MKISFSPPDITEEEINAVAEALRSGWITTGPRTKEFERRIAEYCNTGKAVALNSATACMEMALRLFGIGEGDEVIVPAYTYTASASVVCHVGATIRMIDVAKDSYHIDYDRIEELINEKTKAIIPVDIAGVMVDYDRIRQIVEAKRSLFVPANELQEALGRVLILADSAHGFGASYGSVRSGAAADFTSFSFHAVKNLTTAEGGALTWRGDLGLDDEEIYKKLMLLTLHGQSKDALAKTQLGAWEYDIVGTYYKCNMTDIVASIGLVQLDRYESLLARRKGLIADYIDGLVDMKNAVTKECFIQDEEVSVLRHYTDEYSSSGHLMLVRLLGKDEEYRNGVITSLAKAGVASNVHYKPLPMHTAYKKLGFVIEDYPNAYDMYRNEITLPLNTLLTDEQLEYVCDSFKEALRR